MATTYQVKSGDTLSKIAQQQGVSVSDISGYRSGNPDLIFPGENLIINKTGATSADQVNPVPKVEVPTGNVTQPDMTGVIGNTARATEEAKLKDQAEQERIAAQQALAQSQPAQVQQSFLDKITGKKTRAELATEGQQAFETQTGTNVRNLYEAEKTALAEISKLNEEYNSYVQARDEAIAQAGGRLATNSFINNQVAQIERNAAPRLNALSASIKMKTALMEYNAGRIERADKFINEYVADATADYKDNVDMFNLFYEQNQDVLDRIDSQYKDSLDRARELADQEYQAKQDEAKQKAEMILEAAKFGVDLSGFANSSMDDLQRSYSLRVSAAARAKEAEQKKNLGTGILSSLPSSIQTKVLTMANSFGTTDIVKKLNATVDGINLVNGIDANSKNPADHQTIIYAFAKSLDPESVVREGEYAVIKKYAQSLVNKYGKEVTNAIAGTGFLSQAAIGNIKETMQNNYNSRKPAYDNLYKEKARVINNVAGADVADELLIDYSSGVSDAEVDTQNPADMTDDELNAAAGGSSGLWSSFKGLFGF